MPGRPQVLDPEKPPTAEILIGASGTVCQETAVPPSSPLAAPAHHPSQIPGLRAMPPLRPQPRRTSGARARRCSRRKKGRGLRDGVPEGRAGMRRRAALRGEPQRLRPAGRHPAPLARLTRPRPHARPCSGTPGPLTPAAPGRAARARGRPAPRVGATAGDISSRHHGRQGAREVGSLGWVCRRARCSARRAGGEPRVPHMLRESSARGGEAGRTRTCSGAGPPRTWCPRRSRDPSPRCSPTHSEPSAASGPIVSGSGPAGS